MEHPRRRFQQITAICGGLTLLFFLLDRMLPWGGWFSLFVTATTFFYHFWVRLLVGTVTRNGLRNRIDTEHPWFTQRKWEKAFYERLGVEKWKGRMPTYFPQDFSFRSHTLAEVVQAMCISEVGHEINILCSFLPLLAALCLPKLREDWAIFAITGFLALGADLPFLLMQRYNRPRVMALQAAWEKRRRKEGKDHGIEL